MSNLGIGRGEGGGEEFGARRRYRSSKIEESGGDSAVFASEEKCLRTPKITKLPDEGVQG